MEIFIALMICLVVDLYFAFLEYIQVSDMGWEKYSEDSINKLDLGFYSSFVVYFLVRMQCLSQVVVPYYIKVADVPVISREIMSIFSVIVMFGGFLRLLVFSRINPAAAQIVRLCYNVLSFC